MSNLIVIPASIASRRLLRKPLRLLGGEPLVVRTVLQALKCQGAGRVLVVCDSEEIKDAVYGLCTVVQIDDPGVWCGTQRIALAAKRFPRLFPDSLWVTIVNWQVDEPFVDPEDVSRLIAVRNGRLFEKGGIGTLVCPLDDADKDDLNVVKTMVPRWSRVAPDTGEITWFARESRNVRAWRHLGIYAFESLDVTRVGAIPQSARAREQGLEQRAWLDAGRRMFAVRAQPVAVSVNTHRDLQQARDMVA
jgi:3-deoxy-manno-octulosonate cytidylyltransferase (CMP-KDO synthetase)